MNTTRRCVFAILAGLSGAMVLPATGAIAASAREIDLEVNRALQILYATRPKARELAQRARGILVFLGLLRLAWWSVVKAAMVHCA